MLVNLDFSIKLQKQQRNILLKPQVVKFILYVESASFSYCLADWLACALRRRKTRLVGAQSHNQLFCGRQKSWHLTLGLWYVIWISH